MITYTARPPAPASSASCSIDDVSSVQRAMCDLRAFLGLDEPTPYKTCREVDSGPSRAVRRFDVAYSLSSSSQCSTNDKLLSALRCNGVDVWADVATFPRRPQPTIHKPNNSMHTPAARLSSSRVSRDAIELNVLGVSAS